MNINIYIEDKLGKQLTSYAERFHRKKNSIIREAIRDWLTRHTERKWPETILQFDGIKGFPDIEELRKDISDPTKELF
jgi:hypothetical protein